ncbi:hypothetical protein Syun_028885 [Stephania yunnanensis]|uniref:Uncharacterized protein n=1 Tax=Stephania yunnanensis TaxID=152371 RepID=A0AAP0HJB6_9MAGN
MQNNVHHLFRLEVQDPISLSVQDARERKLVIQTMQKVSNGSWPFDTHCIRES